MEIEDWAAFKSSRVAYYDNVLDISAKISKYLKDVEDIVGTLRLEDFLAGDHFPDRTELIKMLMDMLNEEV